MAELTMRCARCGGPIDADRARAYDETLDPESEAERLCADCAAEAPPVTIEAIRKPADIPDWERPKSEAEDIVPPVAAESEENPRPPEQVLDDILLELKNISRHQTYVEFNVWNVFGGLVQIMVVFLLVWRYFTGHPQDLLWAVVLQVMALTLFILAKR